MLRANIILGRDRTLIVESFFSKLARRQELKERLMRAVDYLNDDPIVHTWTYKLGRAA